MTSNKNLKAQARCALMGNYKILIGASLIAELLFILFGELFVQHSDNRLAAVISILSSLIITLLAYVIQAGFHRMYLNLARGQSVKLSDMFSAFSIHPDKVLMTALALFGINLILILPFLIAAGILIYVSGEDAMRTLYGLISFGNVQLSRTLALSLAGITLLWLFVMLCVNLRYIVVLFCYVDDPEKSVREMLRESAHLMDSHRLRYVGLVISFFGILLLGILSLGIGLFWIIPYFNMTLAIFYDHLARGDSYPAADDPFIDSPDAEIRTQVF